MRALREKVPMIREIYSPSVWGGISTRNARRVIGDDNKITTPPKNDKHFLWVRFCIAYNVSLLHVMLHCNITLH